MEAEVKNAEIRHDLIYEDLEERTAVRKHNLLGKRRDCVYPRWMVWWMENWGRRRVNMGNLEDCGYWIKMCIVIRM